MMKLKKNLGEWERKKKKERKGYRGKKIKKSKFPFTRMEETRHQKRFLFETRLYERGESIWEEWGKEGGGRKKED